MIFLYYPAYFPFWFNEDIYYHAEEEGVEYSIETLQKVWPERGYHHPEQLKKLKVNQKLCYGSSISYSDLWVKRIR